jgi:cyclic pyranopterin phosphate synthase
MPEEGVALSPKSGIMNAGEIEALARIFVDSGVKKIRLTGGEPLVRKDVADIMARLSRLPVELTITTNALLAGRFISDFQNAGIKSLNVSLDTLREDRFTRITRRPFFQQTLDNIHLLIKEGFHVKVNAVIIKGENTDEIPDFIEWTRHTPVHVRFIEFMPFDGNKWEWDRIFSYKDILEMAGSRFEIEKIQDQKHATTRAFQVKGHAGTFAIISSMTNHFCGSCNRLRLTANGRMKNCLFSNTETDLLSPFRNGEDILPLVRESLQRKHFRHGGIPSLQDFDPDGSNRSMILIGG